MAGYLNVDLILTALIGPERNPMEHLMSVAERDAQELMMLEITLYYAFCCLQSDDRLNLPRFRRFLRCVRIVSSPRPFQPPTLDEIAHWRQVALEDA